MGYAIENTVAKPRRAEPLAAQKSASGDFFENSNKTRLENRCNPLKTLQGNQPTPTKIALGVHFKNYLDHVYAVSDDNGNIDEHYRYTAFGEVEIYSPVGVKLASSAIDNEVLWNSRRYDFDTELYYYKYRHYKADYGRWLGRDPIEEAGGTNLYGFVGNDPFNDWDTYGLEVKSFDEDPSTFPVHSHIQVTPGKNGEAIQYPEFTSYVSKGFFVDKLILKGKLTQRAFYRNGLPEEKVKSVTKHERVHIAINKKAWNLFAKFVNVFEGSYCKPCAEKAKKVVDEAFVWYKAITLYQNNIFDNKEYNAGFDTKANLKAVNESAVKIKTAMDELEKCIKAN